MKTTAMYFRLPLTVRGLRLDERAGAIAYELTGGQERRVRVIIRPRADQDAGNADCVASTEAKTNERNLAAFASLARDRLPDRSFRREDWLRDVDFIDPAGRIEPGHVVPLTILPEGMQSFIRQVTDELRNAARRAIGLTRWRLGVLGPHQPLMSGPPGEWSLDGEEWRALPRETGLALRAYDTMRIEAHVRDEVQAFLDRGLEEPLAHAMFREASLQQRENPRSALLIGMAALEIGAKQHISERHPDAAWLLAELQAPPLKRILTEYLFELDGQRLDARRAGIIVQAIDLRNRVAHRPHEIPIPAETLTEILATIRDTLWWLDSLRGFGWAADYQHASPEGSPDA